MKVELECGSFYDFHIIRTAKLIEVDKIIINGNFAEGGRYKDVDLKLEMIKINSWKNLTKYLDKYFKEFHYEGLCPFCNSEKVLAKENVLVKRLINSPKSKDDDIRRELITYECGTCNKQFPMEKLIYKNIILYYK